MVCANERLDPITDRRVSMGKQVRVHADFVT